MGKHRDSVLDLQSFMNKRSNTGGGGSDVIDKSLRASSTSLISILTVKDDGDDEDEEQDPIHNDDDDEDTDLDSVDDNDFNEDDDALSQHTSRSRTLFEIAMEMEKKVLESYENL